MMLAGKKTYIVGIVTIFYAWSAYWGGVHTMDVAVNMTLAALGGMGFRSAMNK